VDVWPFDLSSLSQQHKPLCTECISEPWYSACWVKLAARNGSSESFTGPRLTCKNQSDTFCWTDEHQPMKKIHGPLVDDSTPVKLAPSEARGLVAAWILASSKFQDKNASGASKRSKRSKRSERTKWSKNIQKPLLVYTCLHLALILPRSPGCCRDVRKGSVGISSGQIDVGICWDLENGANYSVLVPTAGIITDVLWQLARTAVCGRAANHVCSRLWTCFFTKKHQVRQGTWRHRLSQYCCTWQTRSNTHIGLRSTPNAQATLAASWKV